jgi:hypothetical protein
VAYQLKAKIMKPAKPNVAREQHGNNTWPGVFYAISSTFPQIAIALLIITIFKSPTYPITNPKPVYRHPITWQYFISRFHSSTTASCPRLTASRTLCIWILYLGLSWLHADRRQNTRYNSSFLCCSPLPWKRVSLSGIRVDLSQRIPCCGNVFQLAVA